MNKLIEQLGHILFEFSTLRISYQEARDQILALIAEQGEPPVLSDKEIDEATYYGIGSRRLYAERNVAKAQRDACIPWGLAQKQVGYVEGYAKGCDVTTKMFSEAAAQAKQAGRREVVEWADNAMGEHPGNNFHVLYKRTWLAYKKSLGIGE